MSESQVSITTEQLEALLALGHSLDAGDLIYVAEMVLGGHPADAHWTPRAAEMISSAGL